MSVFCHISSFLHVDDGDGDDDDDGAGDDGDGVGDYAIDDKCLEFYHMSVFCHMAAISDAIDKLNAPVKILSSERGLPSEMMISVSKLML